MSTTTAEKPSMKLETETCSRCHGSGTYSYCYRYGSTCFKCAGRKVVYTKRGLAAANYLAGLRSKRAADLVPGDQVQIDAITMGGEPYRAWYTIESVALEADGRLRFVLTTKRNAEKTGYSGMAPDNMVRVAQTAEQKAETLARAVAYQETLTKAGTTRKR